MDKITPELYLRYFVFEIIYILCNVRRPIPILVAKVWQRKLDYVKFLQAKYFTSKNIPIYGISDLLISGTAFELKGVAVSAVIK